MSILHDTYIRSVQTIVTNYLSSRLEYAIIIQHRTVIVSSALNLASRVFTAFLSSKCPQWRCARARARTRARRYIKFLSNNTAARARPLRPPRKVSNMVTPLARHLRNEGAVAKLKRLVIRGFTGRKLRFKLSLFLFLVFYHRLQVAAHCHLLVLPRNLRSVPSFLPSLPPTRAQLSPPSAEERIAFSLRLQPRSTLRPLRHPFNYILGSPRSAYEKSLLPRANITVQFSLARATP